VKSFAIMTLSHRLVLGTSAELSERDASTILRDILEETAVPSTAESFTPGAESTPDK